MGRLRLRQGPSQLRLAGRGSQRSSLLGLVLGLGLLCAAPTAASADADLSIGQVDSPDPVLVGQLLTYTLTVENKGPDQATAVQVVDTLPAGVTFDPTTSTPGCAESPPGTVTCGLADIASGGIASVEVKVRAQSAGPITNEASVSSAVTDPNPADNSQSASTTVSPVADLTLTSSAIPEPVQVGDLLTYTFTVQNKGPSAATAVQLTDTLPAGVAFDSASAGCIESSGTVTCDLGTVPANGPDALAVINVRPTATGQITNTASVSSPVADPNTGDNSTTVQSTVIPVPAPPGSPPGSSGTPQKASTLNVVIFGSLVLISGRSVKLVKGRLVPVSITCAGQRKCEGRLTVTSDKALRKSKRSRKRKRLGRLGSKLFSIEGNHRAKVMVPLSRSKVRLLKRLRRVKALATIRETDPQGRPRISTRTFILRAR
jgi:uncharacterized repeat protein (TIGR01451 family)